MASDSRYAEFKPGWPALLSATVGSAVGVTALLFYSLGSFTGALQAEFGWNRTQISSSFLYTTIALTVAAVPLGWLLDRYGPRRIAYLSVPGFTLSLLLLSQFHGDLTQFYLLFALAGLLGAGTTSIVYTKVVNAAFLAARGLALGITLAGLGAAALVLPPLVTGVVQPYGWRAGFLALAVLSLLVIPFALFGLKDPVTTVGTRTAASGTAPESAPVPGAERGEALRSRSFWTMLLGVILAGSSVPALIPHLVPMLTDAGLTPATAARIASLVGLGIIAGRLCIGFLLDRFFAPLVAAPLFLVAAAGCLLLMWSGAGMAPLAALMMGVCFGAEADLIAFLCGSYFGLKSYGFLFGIIYGIFTIAVAIGPIWVGSIYDRTGTYQGALISVAVLLTLGASVLLTLPRKPAYATASGIAVPEVVV
jgi:MFS family permease